MNKKFVYQVGNNKKIWILLPDVRYNLCIYLCTV